MSNIRDTDLVLVSRAEHHMIVQRQNCLIDLEMGLLLVVAVAPLTR